MRGSDDDPGPRGAVVERAAARDIDRAWLEAWFAGEGLHPSWWSNDAGDRYGWHDHPYAKVLWCQRGRIVFHLRDGEVTLNPGDRLDLAPGTDHAATVGPNGVVCAEAAR